MRSAKLRDNGLGPRLSAVVCASWRAFGCLLLVSQLAYATEPGTISAQVDGAKDPSAESADRDHFSSAPVLVTFKFSTPAGCGDPADFARGVERRVTTLQMREDPSASVHVNIRHVQAKVRAELLILLGDGTTLSRVIETQDCDSAVRGIAFIAAVALDAEDDLQLRRHVQPQGPSVPAYVPPAEEKPALPNAPSTQSTPRSAATWGVIFAGEMAAGTAPQPMFGGRVALELRSEPAGWWAPVGRFSASYLRRGGFDEPGGTARFEQAHGLVELCPSQMAWGGFRAEPCLWGGVGAVRSTGLGSAQTAQHLRPWVGLGGALNGRLELSRWTFLVLRGAVGGPLIIDRYQFDEQIFHESGRIYFDASLGLELRVF